jgi:hypothetical protein
MPYCHIIPKIEKYRPVCAQAPESSHKHIDSIERRYDFIIQSFSPVPETLNNPGSRAHFPAPRGIKTDTEEPGLDTAPGVTGLPHPIPRRENLVAETRKRPSWH